MNRRKNNKYKGKKYKKPLDNYIEKYTPIDDGTIINDAYNSIMRYAWGTTIDYYSAEEDKEAANPGGNLSAGLSAMLGSLTGGMGDMGSGSSESNGSKNKKAKTTEPNTQSSAMDSWGGDGLAGQDIGGGGFSDGETGKAYNADGSKNAAMTKENKQAMGGGEMGGGMDALGQMGAEMGFAIASAEIGELLNRKGDERYKNMPDFKGASQVLKHGGKVYKDGGTVEKGKPIKKSKQESKQERYFKKYIPAIQAAAEKLGINVDVGAVATQVALETGYVEGNGLATKNHNYGGIKARGKQPFTIEETREYFKNKEEADKWAAKRKENSLMGPTGKVDKKTGKLEYKVKTPFRKFETPEEGMMAQIKLITIPRYAKRGSAESLGDPGKYFTAVAEGGYATSPTYNQKLINLYNNTTLPILEEYFPGMGVQIQGASNTQNNTKNNTQGSTQQQPVQERQEQVEKSELLSPEELQEYSGSVNAPETYSEKKTSKKDDSLIKTTPSKSSQMPNMNQKRGLDWFKFYADGGKIEGDPLKNTADNSIDFLGQQSFVDMYGIPELNLPIYSKKNDPNLKFNTGMSYPGNMFVSAKGKVGDGSVSGSLEQNIYDETFSPNFKVKGQYPLTENIDITGSVKGDFKKGFKGADVGLTAKFYAGGNIKKETIAEVEGGEAFETPNGEVGEFVGPDHSDDPTKESGIKFQVGDKDDNMTNEIIPEETEIYSKRIKNKKNKTMAAEKLKSAGYIKSLEDKIKENPTDPLLLASYNRAKETVEIQDGAMQRVQAEVSAIENLKGLGTYLSKYGGKTRKMTREMKYPGGGMVKNMDYANGGKVHKYQNGTYPSIFNNFGENNMTMSEWVSGAQYAAQGNKEAEDLENLIAQNNINYPGDEFAAFTTVPDTSRKKYDPITMKPVDLGINVPTDFEYTSTKNYDPIKMKPIDVQSISTNYDPTTVKLIDEPLSNNKFSEDTTSLLDEIAAEKAASTTQGQEEKPYEFTLGDKLGLMGTAVSGLGPMATTFMSRATDKPNQNFYEQFGQEAINTLEGTKGFLGQQFNMQEAKIGEFARNARRRFNSTARSVNQQRSLGQMSNMQANDMLNKAYQQYAVGMVGVDNQLSQLKFQQGLYEAKGATEAADKDTADKDAFFTALNQDVANMGAAMQAGGKGLNAKEYDRDINKLMPMLSPYGIGIRKDARGNYEYYQVATGTSSTAKEVQRIIKQFEQEETAKKETTTEEDATTEVKKSN